MQAQRIVESKDVDNVQNLETLERIRPNQIIQGSQRSANLVDPDPFTDDIFLLELSMKEHRLYCSQKGSLCLEVVPVISSRGSQNR